MGGKSLTFIEGIIGVNKIVFLLINLFENPFGPNVVTKDYRLNLLLGNIKFKTLCDSNARGYVYISEKLAQTICKHFQIAPMQIRQIYYANGFNKKAIFIII